ncbi:uncharacterized protein LOC132695666 isoform X2 [Cylas formicarius]|uniref:uncharacterized protein LOC132695666 isoform X2 n=1 Tax=Cylas formicarius TaxID=197179 RepID=UPI00295859FD|nr:uncharacterized protein LOC132695666 isoform X2 [Cylas formicarius]
MSPTYMGSPISAMCYFPQQFQGEFMMQNSEDPGGMGIQYSTLTISPSYISVWGNCHKRNGNNFVLMVNYSDTNCYTCLHLKLRSNTVLQVYASSQEIISKCFTNEESAEANCPSKESLLARETTEILLFKTDEEQGGVFTPKEYCPIDGKYYTSYKLSRNTIKSQECEGFNSIVDSCPSGSTLNFRLRGCTFHSTDLRFDCLGHWKGPRDENYLVFTDSRYIDGSSPKYRCGLYKKDKVTGKIEMALSSDSTCITNLHNATNGYETFVLAPKTENRWPPEVSFGICSFPKWMYGNWEYVRVEGDTMVYKDHTSFKTYTIKCAGIQEDSDKYLVFSRTQCDEESYNCMRISNRSKNILEFQLGINSSHNKDVFRLCASENFDDNSWITQGRLEGTSTSPNQNNLCPITGEYTGRIPDAPDLCAKLWSDCRAPDLMYYQVSDCYTEEIYEEREYQCLGHWRESALLYTYTERKDVADGTYECFVGSIITDKDIYIKEAGEHCQRNIEPLRYGMKLIKTKPIYSCVGKTATPKIATNATHSGGFTTIKPKYPTSIESNEIPDLPNGAAGSSIIKPNISYLFISLLYFFVKYI